MGFCEEEGVATPPAPPTLKEFTPPGEAVVVCEEGGWECNSAALHKRSTRVGVLLSKADSPLYTPLRPQIAIVRRRDWRQAEARFKSAGLRARACVCEEKSEPVVQRRASE